MRLKEMFGDVPSMQSVDIIRLDPLDVSERIVIEHVWSLRILVGRSAVEVRVDREVGGR